jgi:hypothetical protein
MSRDLSAFQPPARTVDVAPPLDRPSAATLTAEPGPRAWPAAGEWDDAPRRKVTTSIPARLHRLLRDEADRQGRFKGDLVIEALHAHAGDLACSHERLARRRVRVEDPTQCQLYLTDQERQRLDELARRLGVSRSGIVTMLLERALHLV